MGDQAGEATPRAKRIGWRLRRQLRKSEDGRAYLRYCRESAEGQVPTATLSAMVGDKTEGERVLRGSRLLEALRD